MAKLDFLVKGSRYEHFVKLILLQDRLCNLTRIPGYGTCILATFGLDMKLGLAVHRRRKEGNRCPMGPVERLDSIWKRPDLQSPHHAPSLKLSLMNRRMLASCTLKIDHKYHLNGT